MNDEQKQTEDWKLGRLEDKLFTCAKRTDNSLPSYPPTFLSSCKRKAFTLAEVLITLGVIGIVAAMTLPVLIQNYRKQVVETRLKKFYSIFNQTIKRIEADYGDIDSWFENLSSGDIDEDGNYIEGTNYSEIWFKKYFAPYMNIAEIKRSSTDKRIFTVYFSDGSALRPMANKTTTWLFYPEYSLKCVSMDKVEQLGYCSFKFTLNKTLEPSTTSNWDGSEAALLRDCSLTGSSCAKLIQFNGWKVPNNYPRKIKF